MTRSWSTHRHDTWAAYLDDQWRGDPDGVHTVLDLCCGTGLMSAALARLGYQVTGVDDSLPMLARARRRAWPGRRSAPADPS